VFVCYNNRDRDRKEEEDEEGWIKSAKENRTEGVSWLEIKAASTCSNGRHFEILTLTTTFGAHFQLFQLFSLFF